MLVLSRNPASGRTAADLARSAYKSLSRAAYLVCCLGALTLFAIITGSFALTQASHIDVALNPVITSQVNANVHWDRADKVLRFCWTWNGTKARDTDPLDFTHIMIKREINGSVNKVFLPVTPMDNGRPRPFETSRTAEPGEAFSKPLCSIVPPWADERTTFDVEGFVLYPGTVSLMGIVLWNVQQHIPSIHHEGER